MAALLPKTDLETKIRTPNELRAEDATFDYIWKQVEQDMKLGSVFDPSHEFTHIRRVVNLCHSIMEAELEAGASERYDVRLVYYAAVLHDLEDGKYVDRWTAVGRSPPSTRSLLASCPAAVPSDFADRIVELADNVAYSKETKHPQAFAACLAAVPELAVVQDADRLEALGAIGIGRLFCYTGANYLPATAATRPVAHMRGLDRTVAHLDEKLYKLQGMMKTESGRKMAEVRTRRLMDFEAAWREEWAQGEDR